MSPAGALTIDPERSPSAKRIQILRLTIQNKNIHCVFHEPQFGTQLANVLLENTGAMLVTIDPLGLNGNTVTSYRELMTAVSDAMTTCLSAEH